MVARVYENNDVVPLSAEQLIKTPAFSRTVNLRFGGYEGYEVTAVYVGLTRSSGLDPLRLWVGDSYVGFVRERENGSVDLWECPSYKLQNLVSGLVQEEELSHHLVKEHDPGYEDLKAKLEAIKN